MADRVGQRYGDYRLTRLLGRGSFGDVYLAEHIHDTTLAAVKVLQTRLAHEDLKEFINEASTNFRLKHPHIVQMLDFGIGADDIPFLVMDYAPKGTLRQRYPKGTRLPLDTVVSYVKQVAAALQYAHDKRVIHRDIKPENILLGPNNEVWLSDFGIAVVAHSTRSMDIQSKGGTAPYMAPEQIQGKPRPASDQYALGIIAYEWLCGNRPFNGTATEIALQHFSVPPPLLRGKDPTISPDVEQVVLTALAKDPKDRFANISAFATVLEQACLPKQSSLTTSTLVPPTPLPSPSLPPASTVVLSQSPTSLRSPMPKVIAEAPPAPKLSTPLRTPPDSLGKALRALPRQYFKVLTKPSVATFTEEMSKANWSSIWVQLIGLATILSFLLKVVNSLSLSILITSIPLVTCIFFMNMGFTYLIAKGFRGQGTFLTQMYTYLLFWVPLGIIISSLNLVAYYLAELGLYIGLLVALPLALILVISGIMRCHRPIMAVHLLSRGKAVGVVLISMMVVFLVLVLGIDIVSIILR